MKAQIAKHKEAIIRELPRAKGLRMIEYKGDAMIGAHIVPNCKLLIDNTREPQNGDIVVVQRGSQFVVRFFKCNEHKQWLVSASKKYADMLFDDSEMEIYVVVEVITDASLLRDYMC